MSDNSVQGLQNRLAMEGEVLMVHRFHNGSKGLISPRGLVIDNELYDRITPQDIAPAEPLVENAVCIPDGAELVMTDISPAFQFIHDVSPTEVVTFRKTSEASENGEAHRETVEFRNGVFVALEDLEAGQRLGVLALSAAQSIIRRETLNAYIVE